jgi:hypothetical protein
MISRKILDIIDKYTERFLISFYNKVNIRKVSVFYPVQSEYPEIFSLISSYTALIFESGRTCKVFSLYYDNLSFDIFIFYVQTDRRQLLKASLNLSGL